MQNYTLELVADEGKCPLLGHYMPGMTETLTVQAVNIFHAQQVAMVDMKMRLTGQCLHIYHNGVEVFHDDAPAWRKFSKAQQKVIRAIHHCATSREAHATVYYLQTLPADHWFWSRPTAIKDAYTAGGALVHEAYNRQ